MLQPFKIIAAITIVIIALASLAAPLAAQTTAPAGLQAGDHVAIIGDSITEQVMYSTLMDDYFLMCKPTDGLSVTQFGWGGESAPGYANRMANDTLRFKLQAATLCFGMNDGGYTAMSDATGQRYRDGMNSIVDQLQKAGVRLIIAGSPGCVDANTFRNDPKAAEVYNQTLAALTKIAQEVAEKHGVGFANVHDAMIDAMTKAKAKYGPGYALAGGDGVHPDWNGHLVMAYAFLKALGVSGQIGTITADVAAKTAEASDGHKVVSFDGGTLTVESSRYPFCFFGDPAHPEATNATRGVVEFTPFNDELNRFILIVKNAPAKTKVTWGTASKEFTAEQLAKGINLAAEFFDNPFSEPFRLVQDQIRAKQISQTSLVKQLIHDVPAFEARLPARKNDLEQIATDLVKSDDEQRAALATVVKPVTHTIKIEAAESATTQAVPAAP